MEYGMWKLHNDVRFGLTGRMRNVLIIITKYSVHCNGDANEDSKMGYVRVKLEYT